MGTYIAMGVLVIACGACVLVLAEAFIDRWIGYYVGVAFFIMAMFVGRLSVGMFG